MSFAQSAIIVLMHIEAYMYVNICTCMYTRNIKQIYTLVVNVARHPGNDLYCVAAICVVEPETKNRV